jgi:tripartite-type tricarboxylate transporter receptor subunit TctC
VGAGSLLRIAEGLAHSPPRAAARRRRPGSSWAFHLAGLTDQVARLIAERLSAAMGWPFVVENKPGRGRAWPSRN